MTSANPNVYDVYHSPYSICSLMARLTIAMGRQSSNDTSNAFVEHYINIGTEDQLTEGYLKVNPKGQIPAVESAVLTTPLTDSVDVTKYMCSLYPSLAPAPLKQTIFAALEQLHEIQYLSLSFTKQTETPMTSKIEFCVERRMNQANISESYRKALEYKLEYNKKAYYATGMYALEPEAIAHAEQQTNAFFDLITRLRADARTNQGLPAYIFGDEPSALDAHTIVFIARLYDVGRRGMVPTDWQTYGDVHLTEPAWLSVADGKATLPGRPTA